MTTNDPIKADAREGVGEDRNSLIRNLCDLHKRILACWQSPTGEPPPRRPKWLYPEFDDAAAIIAATVEIERQRHDLKELRETIAFIQPALPVLRNLLGTVGLKLGEAKAEEMIAAVDKLAQSSEAP